MGENKLNSGFESLLKPTTVDNERRNDESTNRIPLLLSPAERNALFQLATMCRPEGEIVEIGSYKGGSTILLALATEREVYAIDPHTLACPHHRSFGDNITPEYRAEIEASMSVAQQFRYNLERAGVKTSPAFWPAPALWPDFCFAPSRRGPCRVLHSLRCRKPA